MSSTNEILRRQGYYFTEKKHRAATKNLFWPAGAENYDVAFYNRLAPATSDVGHHAADGKPAVFFMRCERRDEQILLGNLQIDDKAGEFWTEPEVGKILLKTKNLDLALVQHALRHALQAGHKEILFHSGDTMEAAQFKFTFPKTALITEENHEVYDRDYQNKLKILTQLTRGDIIYENANNCLLYYGSTGERYDFCLGKSRAAVVQELLLHETWLLPAGRQQLKNLRQSIQYESSEQRRANFLQQVTGAFAGR